jgi:hypothetical protein
MQYESSRVFRHRNVIDEAVERQTMCVWIDYERNCGALFSKFTREELDMSSV